MRRGEMPPLLRGYAPFLLAVLATLGSGCAAAPRSKVYTAFREANPRSILIVPPVNRSMDVRAPGLLLTILPIPVAERGYYVFPVNLVKRVMEDEGLSDPNLVHGGDAARLCNLFGADAVLFVTIENWVVEQHGVDVRLFLEFDFVLKDGRTGDTLWSEHRSAENRGGSSEPGSSLLANAILRSMPPGWTYVPLARKTVGEAVTAPGIGLPAGPRHKEYGKTVDSGK
jgi:hypothetical protein